MWIFTNKAFVSVVQHHTDPKILVVRARLRGHIEALFPLAHVTESAAADYRFRTFLPRDRVVKVIAEVARGIDYPNFKDSLPRTNWELADLYHEVWDIMRSGQVDQVRSETQRPASKKVKARRSSSD